MQYTSKGLRLPDNTDSFTIDDANFNMDKLNTITDSATKLSTAQKIALSGDATGEVYFDGSIDVTIPTTVRKTALVGSDQPNTQGWYKVAFGELTEYDNVNILFAVTSTFSEIASGILEVRIRHNGPFGSSCESLSWLARKTFDVGSAIVTFSGATWTLYSYRNCDRYGRNMFEVISQSGGISKNPSAYTLVDNTTAESVTPIGTVSSDGFTVKFANQLTTPRLINGVAFDGHEDIDILTNPINLLPQASSIISYVNNMTLPTGQGNPTTSVARILHGSDVPMGYSTNDNDFMFEIYKISDLFWRVIAYDIRSVRMFMLTRIDGRTPTWSEITTSDILDDRGLLNISKDISGADLNDLTQGGKYRGMMLAHAPNNIWYYIDVAGHADAGWVSQILTDFNTGVQSTRSMIDGNWSPWKEITTNDILEDRGLLNISKDISGADLNDLTQGGKYRGMMLAHAPNNIWYYIDVAGHADAGWVSQILTDFNTGVKLTRVKANGNWSSWQEIATVNSTVAKAICDKNGKDITTYDGGGATYEEGNWTPIIYNGASIIISTFDVTRMPAKYYKVGKLVFIEYDAFISSGIPVSVSLISNLPFVTRNSFEFEETLKINYINPFLNGTSDVMANFTNITKITVKGYYKLA